MKKRAPAHVCTASPIDGLLTKVLRGGLRRRQVVLDRADGVLTHVRDQLGQQLAVEIDGRHCEAEPSERNRLEAAARAEVESGSRASHLDPVLAKE